MISVDVTVRYNKAAAGRRTPKKMFLSVLTISASLFVASVNDSTAHLGAHTQDINVAAKQIFGRPNDPEVRQSPGSRIASQAIPEVEDALARANSARNANPPRYHDAEMAYGFTSRLNPRDPRPPMGLGNIAYDQKQYAAAAKMYQEALTMVISMSSFGGATLRGELNPAEQRNMAAQLRIYLGISLLETNDFKNAQAQFERAVKSEPTNPRAHALLGYSFLKQGIKPEAVKAFQEAVRLDPENSDYQQLLQSAQR
ncbi:MAG TPA: tetratricopeptide repeat protein [Pyrinomonadaceae bacterium]